MEVPGAAVGGGVVQGDRMAQHLASEQRQAGGEKVGNASPAMLRNSLSTGTGHCLTLRESLADYL